MKRSKQGKIPDRIFRTMNPVVGMKEFAIVYLEGRIDDEGI